MLGSFSFDIAGVLSIYVDLNRFSCAVPCECQILGYSIFLDRKGFDVVVGASSHLGKELRRSDWPQRSLQTAVCRNGDSLYVGV